MTLLLDVGTEGEALVYLGIYWNLVERIPNKNGCANLRADGKSQVAPEVAKLIEEWQKKDLVKGVYSSNPGDFLELNRETVEMRTFLRMVSEWGRVQWKIKPPRPTILVREEDQADPSQRVGFSF